MQVLCALFGKWMRAKDSGVGEDQDDIECGDVCGGMFDVWGPRVFRGERYCSTLEIYSGRL